MTTEAPPRRFRVGRRGAIHETRPGETFAARCGVLVQAGEPTDEAATCRTCNGNRVWRGGPRRAPRAVQQAALPGSRDRQLTDRLLARLELLNAATFDVWYAAQDPSDRHRPPAPLEVYERPPRDVVQAIRVLQLRYEGHLHRRALANTVAAHDEVLRLQGYLLPDAGRESA